MTDILGKNWKRYLISSAVTFLATFLAVIAVQLQGLTPEAIQGGAIAGFVITTLRIAVKAAFEAVIAGLRRR